MRDENSLMKVHTLCQVFLDFLVWTSLNNPSWFAAVSLGASPFSS